MIGQRLKRAREATGLSLRDLEAAIGDLVSAQAIGKYERNEMMPSSTVLLELARVLKVSPEFLLSSRDIELAGIDFRKAPQASVKEERAVESAVLDQVERYLSLEEIVPGTNVPWSGVSHHDFEIDATDSAERAADRLRVRGVDVSRRHGAGLAGPDRPGVLHRRRRSV